jgi:hypothetical protein
MADGFTVIVPEADALLGKNRVSANMLIVNMEKSLMLVFMGSPFWKHKDHR